MLNNTFYLSTQLPVNSDPVTIVKAARALYLKDTLDIIPEGFEVGDSLRQRWYVVDGDRVISGQSRRVIPLTLEQMVEIVSRGHVSTVIIGFGPDDNEKIGQLIDRKPNWNFSLHIDELSHRYAVHNYGLNAERMPPKYFQSLE